MILFLQTGTNVLSIRKIHLYQKEIVISRTTFVVNGFYQNLPISPHLIERPEKNFLIIISLGQKQTSLIMQMVRNGQYKFTAVAGFCFLIFAILLYIGNINFREVSLLEWNVCNCSW